MTLSDNTFSLVAKGCTVPTTLAVGAQYDCNYTDVAATGTKINIATGDTTQTPPDTGTAKVNAAPAPAPALTVEKGVSLSADGPFEASLTTTLGTTVHYRITITNTGNVTLHGVTLTDNKFDLAAKGCDVPTTLAAGAHFTCNYTSSAVVGTTENTATGDSEETGPEHDTATVTVTAAPALAVTKGVSLTADGPFESSLTTTTGTLVHYRITVTNTGNVTLHGVTLVDNTFDLVAKGCTIPTTLAVGAHFDCDYTDTAATGTKTNIATGDSNETDSDTGTATVTANPVPAPDLRVRKAVSTNADGPFINILNVAPGTTVHYRITVTNTGNVALTGVTLTDNTFDLVAKGCTIPTSLAVGASFDCDYSSVSAETSTVNTATGDSNETGPDSDTATVNPVAQQAVPVLTVEKTNNAPIVHIELAEGGTRDLPTAPERSTVTFTLSLRTDGWSGQRRHDQRRPAGRPDVRGWVRNDQRGVHPRVVQPGDAHADLDGRDRVGRGTVTYKAKVNVGANGLDQPLTNVATIASEETQPDSDTSDVFVPVPPKAETNVPTAPSTDTVEPSNGPSGSSLPLALAVLGVILLAVGVVTPVPATVRRRNRR